MATDTRLDPLIINRLTREQFDSATKSSTELYIVTDDDVLEQQSVLPTADSTNEGKIVQYIGGTEGGLINGYIYQCVANGDVPGTYQWVEKKVQEGEIPGNGKLTIQKNGTTIAEFTANQSTDTVANILADSVATDDVTINKASNDDLQAIGILNKNGQVPIYKWKGTLAEYEALETHSSNWIYYITDDIRGGTSVYTKEQVNALLSGKQDTLTAGANITIIDNVISATGGGSSDFDSLINRPSYNGTIMTHSTNIPEVKTATWDGKQDAIDDLEDIRAGAEAGSTAVQPDDLGALAVKDTVDYETEVTNKPTIPEIDDTSTAINKVWSASKLNTTIGNIESLLANI